MDIQPAHQDCGLRIPAVHLRIVHVRKSVLDRRLEEVGVASSALDAVTAAFRLLPHAAAQIDALWAALRGAGPAASLAVDGAFLGLLGAMLRAAGDERLAAPPPAIGDRRLARVLDYGEAHIDEPLTAGELAAVACVSVFHFGRVFKAALGETPHRYVMGRRVERAKAMLLAELHLDLTSVALATGFASHSHLTEVFHTRVGAAPRRVAQGDGIMSAAVFDSYQQMMRETDYARFEQEHRSGGTLGLNLFVAHQGAMEMVDPPNAEIAFTAILKAEGPMEFDFNDGWSEHPAWSNHFTLQPAHQECAFRIRHPHTILVAGVNRDRLMSVLDEAGVRGDPFGALYARNTHLPEVVALMRRIWAAQETAGAAANLLVDGLFQTALGLLLRWADPSGRIEPAPVLSDARLARVVDFVEAHIDEPLTVGELAGVACVSAFHFGRCFRAATGETPHRYVMGRRVERAKALLLAEPALDVTSVALATGFASQSHLSEVFRARVGAPPGAWRRAWS